MRVRFLLALLFPFPPFSSLLCPPQVFNETTMVPGAAKTATRAIAVAQSRVLKRDDAMLPRWYELSRDYMEPA